MPKKTEMDLLINETEEIKSQNASEHIMLRDEIKQLEHKLESQSAPGTASISVTEIDDLKKDLMEIDSELCHMDALHDTLMTKEQMTNQEFQDARSESISHSDTEKNAARNISVSLVSGEQEKKDADIVKLAEEHMREKQKMHDRSIQLLKKLDEREAFELEIEVLKGKLNVMKDMGDDGDAEVLKEMDGIYQSLSQKEIQLENLKALKQSWRQDIHLQQQQMLDAKQALDLEIEGLKGLLNVMKQMRNDRDAEVREKMDAMNQNLREKQEDLDFLEALTCVLIVVERWKNTEVQEARKELIDALKEQSIRAYVGVRKMGDLDSSPFLQVMKRKCSKNGAEANTVKILTLWEACLRDPNWHPFKIVEIDGEHREEIDEEDEKLLGLRNEMGDEVYKAVTDALMEVNEYDPSGRCITSELWNHKEGRKASPKEGISILLKQLEIAKRKKQHKRDEANEDGDDENLHLKAQRIELKK